MDTTPIATIPKNRRRTQRRQPRSGVKAECRKGMSGLGANLTLQLLDLSDTGIRLIVSQALNVRTEAEILINGYGMKQPIKRLGTVRWQVKLENGSFCVGIEFQKQIPYRDCQCLVSAK